MAGTVPGGTLSAVTDPVDPVLPATLKWAVGLLYAEAAALLVIAALLIGASLFGDPLSPGAAVTEGVIAIALAALLGALARALVRRQSWARGPSVVLQLMLLPIGYFMVGGGLAYVGVPVLLIGLAGAGLLIAPASREALGIR